MGGERGRRERNKREVEGGRRRETEKKAAEATRRRQAKKREKQETDDQGRRGCQTETRGSDGR